MAVTRKNSINCIKDCSKKIFAKDASMIKKRKNCSLKKRKTGLNFKKCLKSEGIDLNQNFRDYSKCVKMNCKAIEKKEKNNTKKQLKKLRNNKNKSKNKKCCKCCAGRYWGKSLPCLQKIYPCCKGVSNCKL